MEISYLSRFRVDLRHEIAGPHLLAGREMYRRNDAPAPAVNAVSIFIASMTAIVSPISMR